MCCKRGVAYAPNTYGGQGCDVGKSAVSGKSEISGEEWMRCWGLASLRMGLRCVVLWLAYGERCLCGDGLTRLGMGDGGGYG